MQYDKVIYAKIRNGEVAVDVGATAAEGSLRFVWTATHETVPAEVHEIAEELLLNGLAAADESDPVVRLTD